MNLPVDIERSLVIIAASHPLPIADAVRIAGEVARTDLPPKGRIVLSLDDHAVAGFVRFDDGSQSWFTPIPRPAGMGLPPGFPPGPPAPAPSSL